MKQFNIWSGYSFVSVGSSSFYMEHSLKHSINCSFSEVHKQFKSDRKIRFLFLIVYGGYISYALCRPQILSTMHQKNVNEFVFFIYMEPAF